ncbi:MAG: A/G-specific adenine glycosylase [Methanomicrobiaceae archaeon]|nr:A/G-specific adenine glycosylase [Methanomicrobiaceae archaeon]
MTLTPGSPLERLLLESVHTGGVTTEAIRLFRDLVLSRYREGARTLPWRQTTDPYRILVSEIMLQQTPVGRVIPKYHAFIERFPDFVALARAPLRDVLAAWQGLGYNRRAIALHRTAERVTDEFGGIFPADVDTIATFPGIGRATAGAISAYAFNSPVVYIETNIRRVFIHFFFQDRKGVHDREILPLVKRTLYRENPREWYNALMDFGTELKMRVENPNRKSAGYSVQSRFDGSDRQIRGTILRVLLERGEVAVEDLPAVIGGDEARVRGILSTLEKEGFVRVRAGKGATKGVAEIMRMRAEHPRDASASESPTDEATE